MNVEIQRVDKGHIQRLISLEKDVTVADSVTMSHCLAVSPEVHVGIVDDRLVCIWGLVPPTLLSEEAYLWLYATPVLDEHKFLFVRKSQVIVGRMLQEYSVLRGVARIGNERAIRWLKWLGAEFAEPLGNFLPFQIRRK